MRERPTGAVTRSVADWTMRLLLAAVFLFQGTTKFGERPFWQELFAEIGLGEWFRYFTGAVEILGALLLIVPRTTVLGALILSCTMLGAFMVHVFILGIGLQSVLVAILFGLLVIIGWSHRRQNK